jgi:hypothetical protein
LLAAHIRSSNWRCGDRQRLPSSARAKLTEPELFLCQFEDRLVILDEIHRTPRLFQAQRSIIDEGQRRGRPVFLRAFR